MYADLSILAAFLFVYSLASGALERTAFGGAILFTGFGLAFGPLGLGLLKLEVDTEALQIMAELTLALVLFTDAANADLRTLKSSVAIPQRLLLFGLPLVIVLGFGLGSVLLDGLTLLEAAILATVLAPTDADLARTVVTNKAAPPRLREGLNVESGLNDGICVPVILVLLALATNQTIDGGLTHLVLWTAATALGVGAAVGAGLTLVAARLIRLAEDRDWIDEDWRQLLVVGLAVMCFASAQALGGSGFIAAFTGGLLFDAVVKHHKPRLLGAAESFGDMLAMLTWVLFGSAVIGRVWGSLDWTIPAYAVLSLTVIRMVPVFLVLTGTNLHVSEKLFIGWFGPRGLASIVFALLVLDAGLPHGHTIVMTAVCTILLSIVAHGLTAHPALTALSARRRRRADPGSPGTSAPGAPD